MKYIENPKRIEEKSFQMIEEEIQERKPGFTYENPYIEHIIKRVIHTSADFEYLDMLCYTEDFVTSILGAFQDGCTIYTDTTMALSGINKRNLEKLQIKSKCLISDERVIEYAKKNEITRSMAAVSIALEEEGDKIFVFGNAPTALFKLLEHYEKGDTSIKAVVGVPVGFVGAKESKEQLHKCNIPHITSISRKGGSNIAASIINAITYEVLK